jgi:hypothetical protein
MRYFRVLLLISYDERVLNIIAIRLQMQECVRSLYLISQLGNKCQSSSPSDFVPEETGGARVRLLLICS